MKPYVSKFSKAAKKVGISEEDANGIVVHEHEVTKMLTKKETVLINIDLPDKVIKKFNKIAKALKVSVDSVAGHALIKQLKAEDAILLQPKAKK